MRHRTYRGRIDYVHRSDGDIGREWFSVTVQPNGDRTLRAHCEMDDVELLRDVVQTLDGDWLPVDVFVRLTQHGRFVGSGWFNFEEDGIQCESVTADAGRVSQWMPTEGRVRLFASHPLSADGMQCAGYDHGSDERIQTIRPWANPSPRPDGASGPIAAVGKKVIEYVGEEEITVPAGTFETRHYLLHPSRPDWTPLETWVTGPDYVFVKLSWDVTGADYVLAELEL